MGLAAGRRFALMDRIDRQPHRIQDGLRMGRRWCSALSSGHLSAPGARRTRPRRSARPGARAFAFALGAQALGGLQPCELLAPALPASSIGPVSTSAWSSSHWRTAAGRVRLCQALAVNVDQMLGRLAQLRGGGGVPLIHARLLPCASIVRRSSSVAAPAGRRGQPGPSSQAASAGGTGSNSAAISARLAPLADHAGVAPAAQHDLQRVDQDGLARAWSLRSAPRSRGRKSTSRRLTMTKLLRDSRQHHWPPSPGRRPFQCSLRRSVA